LLVPAHLSTKRRRRGGLRGVTSIISQLDIQLDIA
jgi:hypothetical protein